MTDITDLLRHYRLSSEGVLHIGANDGSEISKYVDNNIKQGILVEANPEVHKKLQQNISSHQGFVGLCALCSDYSGKETTFNVATNEGQSSSMYAFGTHKSSHPTIEFTRQITMITTSLDDLLFSQFHQVGHLVFDALVVDTQGAEIDVLAGATETMQSIKFAMIEVSDDEVYSGGAKLNEIQSLMSVFGFDLQHMFINEFSYGDAFFIRTRKSWH